MKHYRFAVDFDKNTAFVEDTPSINVRGCPLTPLTNSVEAGGVTLPVTWESYSLGLRCWFVCPACERRQLKLYWFKDSWACRKCHGLVYRSQWLSKWQRLLSQREELLNEVKGGRTKWQHLKTFDRRVEQLVYVDEVTCRAFLASLIGNKGRFLRAIRR